MKNKNYRKKKKIETKEPIEIEEQGIESKLPIEMTMEDERR